MIRASTPSGSKDIANISVLTPEGSVVIDRVAILTAEGSRELFARAGSEVLDPSIEPPFASSSQAFEGTRSVSTPTVTVRTNGGREPFTFAWVKTAGSPGWTISDPAKSRTYFTFPTVPPGEIELATFQVTVTDSVGRVGTSSINAQVRNYGGLQSGTELS